MSDKYRILYMENPVADAEQVRLELSRYFTDFDYLVANTENEYQQALDAFLPDVILHNIGLAGFTSAEALLLLKNKHLHIPFIIVTDTLTEDIAASIVREGADDYWLKSHLKRLPHMIINAVEKYRFEKDCRLLLDGALRKGEPLRSIGVNRDVTQSKEAERELKNSELKYSSFFESSMDGILLMDDEGNIFEANPAACEIFQMSEKELCTAGREGIIDMSDTRVEAYLKERRHRGKARAELTAIRKNKTRFPIELASAPYKENEGTERYCVILRDITDRRNTELEIAVTSQALEEALGALKNIMNSSLDVICTIDKNGKFCDVSRAAECLWGYKCEELVGKSYIDIVAEEDVNISRQVAEKIMAGHPVTTFQNHYRHKDGSLVPLLWSARWDEDTQLMYCTAKDATEKEKIERLLFEERQQFYDLFKQAPACVGVLKGPNHVFDMVNPPYLQLIGREDIIGKPAKEVLPEADAQGLGLRLDEVYRTGETFVANEMLVMLDKKGDGKLIDHYLNFIYQAYRNAGGDIVGIFFFVTDVTEQVLSRKTIENNEKRFRQIVETAQEGICTVDEFGRINFVNSQICTMLGYEMEELLGKSPLAFIHPGEQEAAQRQMEKNAERSNASYEVRLITKEGRQLDTNLSTNVILDSEGHYKGALAMITDITERKAIDKRRLLKSEILKNIGQSVVCIDMNGIITYSNKAAETMLGWTEEELIGAHILDRGPADEAREMAKAGFEDLFKGNSWSGELLMKRKDGSTFVADVTDTPLLDENNKQTGIIGIATDITERKKAEQLLLQQKLELEKANEQQTAILNALPPHIALLDKWGTIFQVNESWMKFGRENGASEEERWVGKNYIYVSERSYGPDRYYGTLIADKLKQIINGGLKQFSMEYPCHSPGQKRWFNVLMAPLMNKTGEGAVVLHVDITERKLSEERMQEMHEQLLASQSMAQIGSWHCNITSVKEIDSYPIICSAEALLIAGFDAGYNEITYGEFLRLTHPDDIAQLHEASELLFKGIVPYYKIEHRIITPGGIVKWVCSDAKLTQAEDTNQHHLKIFGTIKDITLAKEQEMKLAQNSKERTKLLSDLVIRNKSLEQFAYIVSHNLRAPVANILGIAGILAQPDIQAEEKDMLIGGIIESVEKLDVVVRDLNHILQVKRQHKELEETVHFSKFIDDIKVSIKHIISDDIQINYDFSEVNELFTIRSYLYSIFYNLILNSIKYRQQDVPCIINVKSHLTNNSITILLSDNGMGIDLKRRGDDVFGLYKRFHAGIEGKGMGLYMVKTQVEAVGGNISIESEINKGTTFTITFEL